MNVKTKLFGVSVKFDLDTAVDLLPRFDVKNARHNPKRISDFDEFEIRISCSFCIKCSQDSNHLWNSPDSCKKCPLAKRFIPEHEGCGGILRNILRTDSLAFGMSEHRLYWSSEDDELARNQIQKIHLFIYDKIEELKRA